MRILPARILPMKIILAWSLFLFLGIPVSSQDIQTILDRFEKTLETPSIQGTFEVELIATNGDTREVKARAYQKLIGKNQNNRLFIFDYPPRVRGTGILLHSYFDDRENNMWIYLPTIRRVKRIALASSGGGYFMGSDFTYRDLINNNANDMEFEKLEDGTADGKDCYVLKSWGKSLEIRQEMGYSHIISYYNKENNVIIRREYYDFNDKLLKIYEVHDLFTNGTFYYPTKISMSNVQTKHKSVIEVTDVSTEEIPDRYFTIRYLRNSSQ